MKIWMLNHYATNMYFDGAGRHHSLAKYLIRMGHDVRIFCSNYGHNGGENMELNGDTFIDKIGNDNVKYTFVETAPYVGNGFSRIKNMALFYKNVQRVVKNKIATEKKPDVILSSSVHPLTLVAGIKIAKKYKIPCICEIRDIWPLSLVEYSIIKEKSLINYCLTKLEYWTYKKADKVIFTMPGGKDYIKDKGWGEKLNIKKIFYLNNGVDLEKYCNDKNLIINDEDLVDNLFKVIYTGTISKANEVYRLVEVAEKIKSISDIKILIYGDGNERCNLEEYCQKQQLYNIIFKGRVDKSNIPYILSKSDVNIFNLENYTIYKYGISMNKYFEYLAAGKPIITNCEFGYNDIINENCGIVADDLAEGILKIKSMNSNKYNEICNNSLRVAEKYSYKKLAENLLEIINI